MIFLLWNYRGLWLDMVVRDLHRLIRRYRPSVIFLSETKMKDDRIDGVRCRMGYTYRFTIPPMGAT